MMIRSQVGSTRDCGVILKLERFSHLSVWSFGLGSFIGLEYLSLVLSLRASAWREMSENYPKREPFANV